MFWVGLRAGAAVSVPRYVFRRPHGGHALSWLMGGEKQMTSKRGISVEDRGSAMQSSRAAARTKFPSQQQEIFADFYT